MPGLAVTLSLVLPAVAASTAITLVVVARLRRRPAPDALAVPIEAIPAAVLIVAPDGTISRANALARSSFPGPCEDGRIVGLGDGFAAAIADVFAGVDVDERELAIDLRGRHTFALHAARTRGTPDDPQQVVAILTDITGVVDFRESRRLFSAAVSHELRTPLARILGLAETLGLPQPPGERDALVTQIEHEVDNMRRLIDEMLLLAALDRGEVSSTDESSDPGAVAAAVVADRRARRGARTRGLDVDAAAGLRVPVPGRLLEVALGNIVDNALRHAGGEATVAVRVADAGGQVEITVADDGVGIEPEHLPHVFERFYRAESSRAGPGTGLGLAVVKHIAEAHGGFVTAESVPGEGTTITVRLPHAPAGLMPGTA